MNLVKASLKHPQVIYFLTALACLAGIAALRDMPRREDPKVTIRRGLVLAAYPGASAEQVENQVTRKIEQKLFGYEEVRKGKTVSTSMAGGVVIDVALVDEVKDADPFWSRLRHDLNELSFTEMPRGVLGPIVRSDFGDVIAVLLAVTGDRYSYAELETYLKRLETELLRIPAVSKVKRIGEQKEKIYVTSTTQRVVQYGITPLHLAGALQQQNVISEAGSLDAAQTRAPIRTTGLFKTEDQINRQMVGMGPTGLPIYVSDLADVERRDADPEFLVRANGQAALMLTLEMRAGYNIVDFGHEINQTIDRVKAEFPPGVNVAAMVDQPKVVEERISHFLREFALALIAVIAATLILLPFPVAAVAATAIPVTVALTFAMLRGLGIELHQVSLAALIVVLGMVVDDAIVIADNYVELLDHGLDKAEAAWRSASDLAVPVLAATLTIVAAFIPLAFLPGQMGEFMVSLPITVAIALANSYVVAMLLTPLLCRTFIKKGLHAKQVQETAKKRRGALDVMQDVYDRSIAYAMRHRRATLAFGVLAVVAGLGLGAVVDQRFFPPAERDEFAINVWLPEGTRLDVTNQAVLKIEQALKKEKEVLTFASFVGQGGPRFFFSFEPALPRQNIAQIIVHTTEVDATPHVVEKLRAELPLEVPNAEIDVQRLTQGDPMWAPVEVRITGPEVGVLKEIGTRVANVLEKTQGAFMVRNDWREDSYAMEVELRPELASRLGMTNTVVSNMLASTFLGIPVSTYWEGDKPVDIVLRLDESHRSSYEDIGSTYMVSQFARMPLNGIAEMRPVWQTSRVVHRNGVRTMTVGAFAEEGTLASEVYLAAKPTIDTLSMPAGYDIKYGGEVEIQGESFGHLSVGMAVGVLLIFLILVFQFQKLKDAAVVMVAIPLSLFGAFFGLLITGNPFGFTAFMGLISLSGVVVRNAIILIDFIREKRAEGGSLEEAALEAGRRRLRPIFLTTVAAAAGLTPMILAQSGLWSPLASVIAVGLMFSMVFTLLVVPVLYVMVTKEEPQTLIPTPIKVPREAVIANLTVVLIALGLAVTPASAQEPRPVSLEEALTIAKDGNAPLKAMRQKVSEMERNRSVMFSNYLPRISTQGGYLASDNTRGILMPKGSLGYFPELGGVFPPTDRTVPQGGSDIFIGLTTLAQPITQVFKIKEGVAVARADEDGAKASLRKAEQDVALGVIKAYAGVLIAQMGRDVARVKVTGMERRVTYQKAAVTSGMAMDVAEREARVRYLQARHALLEREGEYDDLSYTLKDVLGMQAGTQVQLTLPAAVETKPADLEQYIQQALDDNPEVLEARALVRKASHGVGAARADYIPQLGLMGMHFFQNSVPFFPKNTLAVGAVGSFTLFDFGARRNALNARKSQLRQAESNLVMVEGRVRGEVEAAHRKVARAWELVELAREGKDLRTEGARIKTMATSVGYALDADTMDATADRMEAELDYAKAQLGYRIALAELAKASGQLNF